MSTINAMRNLHFFLILQSLTVGSKQGIGKRLKGGWVHDNKKVEKLWANGYSIVTEGYCKLHAF